MKILYVIRSESIIWSKCGSVPVDVSLERVMLHKTRRTIKKADHGFLAVIHYSNLAPPSFHASLDLDSVWQSILRKVVITSAKHLEYHESTFQEQVSSPFINRNS